MNKEKYIKTDIFKYELYQTILDVDVEDIKKYCLNLKNKNKGRIRSNLNGWQSEDLKIIPESLQKLKELIELNLNIFAKHLHINKKLYLENIWVNISEYKDSNVNHIHPNSVLSGVFYLDVSEDTGSLHFYNPAQFLMDYVLNGNVNKYAETNSCTWTVDPICNLLLLFPGWLEHSVGPNLNKKRKRISLSFNSKIQ